MNCKLISQISPQSCRVESGEGPDDDVSVELAAGDAREVRLGVLDQGVDVGVAPGVQLNENISSVRYLGSVQERALVQFMNFLGSAKR